MARLDERPMPVDSAVPRLLGALRERGGAVLTAAPGAGKTTRVPLRLLGEPWLEGRRILMLEPRRMAARSAAHYMASLLGERPGRTVGYRIRLESRVGPETRIEVVTEGVLTRMLQSDPALEGYGIVIFDEFHERSLHADLGLALCLEAKQVLRDDLRLLVMSATLDAEPVAKLMGGVPVVTSEGRQYPVETRYLPKPADVPLEEHVVRAIRRALEEETGGVLVFLPGEREIRRTAALLGEPEGTVVLPLYGALPQHEQDRALADPGPGVRKIVLATTIAETSLTVSGIRVVIDSGLRRAPKFSPRTGMTRLVTTTVSLDSAEQRRGRAGRTEPGVCYRLWSEEQERAMPEKIVPEMLEADLAPLLLELDAWGATDPRAMPFLDPPPEPALRQAAELLEMLGARDAAGRQTPHGRRMAETGLHPRLAHMALRARELGPGAGALACELAALLEERDVLAHGGPEGADIRVQPRLDVLRAAAEGRVPAGLPVHESAARRAAAEADRLKRQFGIPADARPDDRLVGLLLGFAYPDRIGMRRGAHNPAGETAYTLAVGRGAVLPAGSPLAAEPSIVAVELDDAGIDSRIRLAAPFHASWLTEHFADRIREERVIEWDRQAEAVRARRLVRFGAIVLKEAALDGAEPEEIARALLNALRAEGLDRLPWTKQARQLRGRIAALHRLDPSWPDVSDEALLDRLEEWLLPHVIGVKSLDDLKRLDLVAALESLLDWSRRRELDEQAPTHFRVPSGSRIAIDYSDPSAPVLAARLQELFGMSRTPVIGYGRLPLTLHILSPAMRPVQVTRDLEGFWKNGYFEVRKELKGRYPKHYWPDDPAAATATRHLRPKAQEER
ncbi:MAG: ATP-dependent helicase HrpB [Thermobacillus sp. ZCTH02-B1]|uniref:ATP-dependent helicase HrpB n=1 Tax=Thermobacillus sp. ZCTH02-B1 TaxID=1858795 RepID=UPI000B577D1B|nr:ATP-dependent helicase HrpB [Thermobacillus sp. ZCTH02-B1]OUM96571.1 MAG: ATP-dependent helicase HrpB [Thermobacillus sp. ZCTH02-B1]